MFCPSSNWCCIQNTILNLSHHSSLVSLLLTSTHLANIRFVYAPELYGSAEDKAETIPVSELILLLLSIVPNTSHGESCLERFASVIQKEGRSPDIVAPSHHSLDMVKGYLREDSSVMHGSP